MKLKVTFRHPGGRRLNGDNGGSTRIYRRTVKRTLFLGHR